MGISAERRTAYQASAAPIDYQGDMENLNDIKRVREGIVSPAAVKRGSHKKSAVLMRRTENKEPCRSSIDDFQKHDRKRQNPGQSELMLAVHAYPVSFIGHVSAKDAPLAWNNLDVRGTASGAADGRRCFLHL